MNILKIFSILLFAVFITCAEKPTEPVRDNPLDENNPQTGGDPFELTAEIAGGGIQLNWQTVEIAGVIGYNIYRNVNDSSFTIYHEVDDRNTASYIDTEIVNGNKYSYYIVTQNEQGQESTSNTAEVEINNTPYLSIDEGDTTSTREVNLTLLAFGAQLMQIGTPNLSAAVWVSYETSTTIELETGEGIKTVEARFIYDNGDTSDVVNDEIQPLPMNPSVIIADDSTYTTTREVELTLSADAALWMRIWNDSSAVSSNSAPEIVSISKGTPKKQVESFSSPTDDWIPYSEAESWRMMTNRIFKCMDQLSRNTSPIAIIVSHGNAGIAIIQWWLQLAESCRSGISFDLDPCSISHLSVNSYGERTIVKLNDTCHLQGNGVN